MSSAAPALPRSLLVICLAGAGWAFGFGLGAPLASLWLNEAGFDITFIGLNTGVYYAGIALAATAVPWLMRRWGRGCPVVGMVVSGLTVAAFPWGACPAGWFALRALNGVAGAMSLIPIETLVNRLPPAENRARHFGFYAFAVALGWALGNVVGLGLYAAAARLAFALGGVVSVLAGAAFLTLMPPVESVPEEQRGRGEKLGLVCHFLSYGSAWSQGFLEGGMVGLLPLYLLSIGLSQAGVGWLTSGIMIGVIVFQVPVAWLADRLGRRAVLVGCYLAAAAGLLLVPGCGPSAWLAVWLLLVGACSGAFYPLGLAILGEEVPADGLPRASAAYLGINCVGSWIGPGVTGFLMDHFGARAMFGAGEAAVVGVLLAWLGLRTFSLLRKRASLGGRSAVETREAA